MAFAMALGVPAAARGMTDEEDAKDVLRNLAGVVGKVES